MTIERARLRITILKDTEEGSMGDESRRLLRDADFKFRPTTRVDFADVSKFPMRIRMLRNGVVASDLLAGRSELAILGMDMIKESEPGLIPLMPLEFSTCGLYLGVRNNVPYEGPESLKGLRVATSYIKQTREYFDRFKVNPIIIYRPGGEESFVDEEDYAEACVVISESGTSFAANHLTPKELLLESQAYLVASPTLKEKKGTQAMVEEILKRIVSVVRGRAYTKIEMNVPRQAVDDVVGFLPSAESPTIARLEKEGWVAISSLIPRVNFWDLVFELQERGARDIIEAQIKKVIPNRDDRDIMRMMGLIYG